MGLLVDGKWETGQIAIRNKEGQFMRPDSSFRNWITASGESGFKAEPGRYHLYISYACPWASRALIFLVLKELQDVISYSSVEPVMLENGWEFSRDNQSYNDPLYQASYLYEIYQKANSNYNGKVTVPVLWDKETETIVNNESAEIIRMLNFEFKKFTKETTDYYPASLQSEIDEINKFVYANINNGVYRCGFASSQKAYDEAFDKLFNALDEIENLLAQKRYLLGDMLTEADWRLFTTLVRFDVVYYGHFKCNLKQITDYPNLSNYLRELYQFPGIKNTVRFDHIKKHYYMSHKFINPTGIVPRGPIITLDMPHDRARFN